jgi:alpha-L-fucosidase
VEQYAIEVWHSGQWQPVATGRAIGHKKIDTFPFVSASRVRLNILASAETAAIREFQLFLTRPPR